MESLYKSRSLTEIEEQILGLEEYNTLVGLPEIREKEKNMECRNLLRGGSSLPLTLINTILNFPYPFFNFFVIFFKTRNSS